MKLKSAIAFLIAVPVIAFGQVNEQVCFQASEKVEHAPSQLCFVSVEESTNSNSLKVLSGDINVPEKLTITSVSRQNEERFKFKAEGKIAEDWEIAGCGRGFATTLKVEGVSQNNEISAKNLKVAVEVETVRDTCHDIGYESKIVEYDLK